MFCNSVFILCMFSIIIIQGPGVERRLLNYVGQWCRTSLLWVISPLELIVSHEIYFLTDCEQSQKSFIKSVMAGLVIYNYCLMWCKTSSFHGTPSILTAHGNMWATSRSTSIYGSYFFNSFRCADRLMCTIHARVMIYLAADIPYPFYMQWRNFSWPLHDMGVGGWMYESNTSR